MKTGWTASGIAASLAAARHGAPDAGIDLDCETRSAQLTERLADEGLLTQSGAVRQRALAVTRELCMDAEASAQQQHEAGRQEALDNRLLETHPGKTGNRRLKNLNRQAIPRLRSCLPATGSGGSARMPVPHQPDIEWLLSNRTAGSCR